MNSSVSLHSLPSIWKQLLSGFLVVVSIGYTLGVFFVDHTTHTTPSGIAERYLGSEESGVDIDALPPDRELQYEKSPSEVLNITHTHMISLAMVFLLVGAIFALVAGIPPWLQSLLIIEPFASIVVTFGGIWLLRYSSPSWAVVIAVSGTLMSICFYAMVGVSLWQLMKRA